MTIETKYNIGDEVWVMYNGKPHLWKIDKILTGFSKYAWHIQYRFSCLYFHEHECFPTKEELLKSL